MSLVSLLFILFLLIMRLFKGTIVLLDPVGSLTRDKRKAIHLLSRFEERPIHLTVLSCIVSFTFLGLTVYSLYDLVEYLRVLYNF